mgnify:CR=1
MMRTLFQGWLMTYSFRQLITAKKTYFSQNDLGWGAIRISGSLRKFDDSGASLRERLRHPGFHNDYNDFNFEYC